MKITGKLHSFGVLQIAVDVQQTDGWIAKQIRDVKGVLIECTDDATIRDASELFCATVDIYPHPVNELIAGECTPENYAHALARANATADHLAREVRSSQALLAKQAEQERLLSIYRTKYHEADRALQQAHADLAAAQDLLTGCTPPGMSIREDERGWRVTSDVDTWWYATEQEAHAVAWSDYRDAQTETLADKARAARAGDEDDDSRGRDEEGNALT